MFVINGNFLCRNLTGIERFSLEVCKRLDLLVSDNFLSIYVPHNAKIIPDFKNIKIILSDKDCKSFPLWDHFIFSNYLHKNKHISIDFSNITPLFNPGYVFIHDIYAKLYPEDFNNFKDKLRRFYMCWMYSHAIKKAKKIFTVSEFSKNQICDIYNVDPNTIFVIPNGWDHFKNVNCDFSIFDKFPSLAENEYFFTLGSLQKRKNLKWISDYAKNHPTDIFAISGKTISGMISEDIKILQTLSNVILLGYVSDEEVKALMTKCKAFVFPSYYEGFGIPPLEALSVGAKIVISNSACLPEIYKNTAYYIDPDNSKCDLNLILQNKVDSPDSILENYSYDKAAQKLYNVLYSIKE